MIRTTARFRARSGCHWLRRRWRAGVVIRQEVGGSIHPGEPPAPAEFEPHLRASLDVADLTRLQATLGDEPERPAVQAVADRGSPGHPVTRPRVSSSA